MQGQRFQYSSLLRVECVEFSGLYTDKSESMGRRLRHRDQWGMAGVGDGKDLFEEVLELSDGGASR